MRVLVIAPHPDDEILGVGGTIAKRSAKGDDVYVGVVTTASPTKYDYAKAMEGKKECEIADGLLGVKYTEFFGKPGLLLDGINTVDLNASIKEFVDFVKPRDVYIPHYGDIHFEHRLIAQSSMVALRPHVGQIVKNVYAYEVLSETGWACDEQALSFKPNVFEDISDYIWDKIDAMRIMKSQLKQFPNARSIKAIRSLAEYRGASVGVGYAEAFSLIRSVR